MKQVLPTRVGGTRWLPHLQRAIVAFFSGYKAIRNHLNTASHDNPKAGGFAKLVQDGNLVVFLVTLEVLISPLVKLSLCLQRKDLTLADASIHLTATRDVLGQIRHQTHKDINSVLQTGQFQDENLVFRGKKAESKLADLAANIIVCLESRIPDTPVLRSSSITNRTNWPEPGSDMIADYGNEQVFAVTIHFGQVLTDAGVDVDEVDEEWLLLKALVYKKFGPALLDVAWPSVNRVFQGQGVSNVLSVIDILLSLPPTSVKNEQVFSIMKLTKGKRRGQMKNETLNSLLAVSMDKSTITTFNPKEAIEQWMITPSGLKRRVGGYKSEAKKAKVQRPLPVVVVDEDESVASEGDEEPEAEDPPAASTSTVSTLMNEMISRCKSGYASSDEEDSDDEECEMTEKEIDHLLALYSRD